MLSPTQRNAQMYAEKYADDIVISHMKMCETRSEYRRRFRNEYAYISRHKKREELFTKVGLDRLSNYKKCGIYAYEFPDKHVYVGLTGNFERRNAEHHERADSPVNVYAQQTNQQIPVQKIVIDYEPARNAALDEGRTIDAYVESGWCILNKAKAGSLGYRKLYDYTFEECEISGKKYSCQHEWCRKEHGYYIVAKRNGWLEQILPRMWVSWDNITIEDCIADRKKYKTAREWMLKSLRYYQCAEKRKWLAKINKTLNSDNTPKEVLQYDLEGNLVAKHRTTVDAAKSVNGRQSRIYKVCQSAGKSMAYGYKWRFTKC